jgi:hypothetical protein
MVLCRFQIVYNCIRVLLAKQYVGNAGKTDGIGFAFFISGYVVCSRLMKEKSTLLLPIVGRLRIRFETL